MGRLSGFKCRIIVKKCKKLGFSLDRQCKGSHESWCNVDGVCVIIPKHGKDLGEGTLSSILKQAEIDVDAFLKI